MGVEKENLNGSTPSLFVNHRAEKLSGAIAYFLSNTRHCHTLKLFKLLNFLDFEHYRQAGRSVTGLDYHAFPMGPVPAKLYRDIQRADGKGVAKLEIRENFDDLGENLRNREFKSKEKFDADYFTPRELEIMERLVFFFGEVKSELMSAYSHDPGLPWKKIYGEGEGKGQIIPYDLALQSEPLVTDEPTIEDEELSMMKEVFLCESQDESISTHTKPH